jgi:hypothetical protein
MAVVASPLRVHDVATKPYQGLVSSLRIQRDRLAYFASLAIWFGLRSLEASWRALRRRPIPAVLYPLQGD